MNTRYLKTMRIIVVAVVLVVIAAGAGRDEDVMLPDAVKTAISAAYPGAEIEESQLEEEGIKVYEVELEQDDREIELTISADGEVIEEEREVPLSEVPEAVRAAIAGACEGGEIEEVTEEVTYWVVTLEKLERPQRTYEVEAVRDGNEVEIEFAADGTILEQD